MNHKKLYTTHKKLSILFTFMVCFIVFALGLSMLGAKFYNELRIQKGQFDRNSQEVQSILNSQNIALRQLFFNQILEKRTVEERFGRHNRRELKTHLSFLIINSKNEIVFENILEDVNFGELNIPQDHQVYVGNGIIYRIMPVNPYYGSKILFYETLQYNGDMFISDILLLFIIVIIFSYFVYFLGYRFVGRTLTPVSENLDDMQSFIHNAGHELKTPLAIIRGNLQVMQIEKKYDSKLLKKSLSQLDNANALIESLRELSELGNLREKSSLHLKTEISHILDSFTDLIKKKDIVVHNYLHERFYITAHPHELQVFFSNLIKNAIIYNKHGGSITFKQKKNIIEISDTGKGIKEHEFQKIFERFYRSDEVRNSSEGFGIGLSLVKKIADINGWKIEVESAAGKGSTFRIIF